ncbi:MAG: YbaN family protein [Pseudomonadota bacterium]
MRYLWISLGWLCVGLGLLGAFLPLLPTTPFLLLAAYAFSRGSERLHEWLVSHPKLGPPIRDWQNEGAISRRTKVVATVSVAVIFGLSLVMSVPQWAIFTQAGVLSIVLFFLWTRKEPEDKPNNTPVNESDRAP